MSALFVNDEEFQNTIFRLSDVDDSLFIGVHFLLKYTC